MKTIGVRRRSTEALLILSSAVLLCAWALPGTASGQIGKADPAWAQVVSAAKAEGKVLLYCSVPIAIIERLKADFEKAYPEIALGYNRMPSGPLNVKLDQERATKTEGGDVLITTELGWAEDRVKDGTVKAPIGPDARAWPSKYLYQGVVPMLELEPITIAYNTNLVKTPPAGYLDLLKPEYKGKVGILDIQASTLVVAFYDWLGKAYGADYLTRLAANQPSIYVSVPTGVQSVGSGALEIASFVNTAQGKPLIDLGAPMKMVIPSPAFGTRFVGMALGWSKRPNAAQVFMNYVMSVRGQTVWTGNGDGASPLPNIPGSLDGKSLVLYDPAPYTADVVKAQIAKWNQIFRKR